jgi:hypothetical protein
VNIFRSQPWFNRSTATAVAGAATLDSPAGEITSESLTTAGLGFYPLTLTNAYVNATSKIVATVNNGTNSTGAPAVARVTPSAGSLVIQIRNEAAVTAFNGTLVISFVVLG